MDRRSAAIGVGVVLAAFACAFVVVRTAKGPVVFGMQSGDPVSAADPPSRPLGEPSELLLASRCVELAPATSLADVAPGPLDFGDAVIDGSGLVAIGVVRTREKSRVASVITFAMGDAIDGASKASIVDLASSVGDDPPPHPFVFGRTLAGLRTETTRERRRMIVTGLGTIGVAGAVKAAPPLEIASVEQTKDESLAFDVAADGALAIAVWDDDDAGRGVIRAARIDGPSTTGRVSVVLSPKTTDAEAPRIVPDGSGGAWVAWIARKAELDAGPAEVAGHFVESPAEAREGRWVEVARVDGNGALRGVPLRLTPGRVSDFDLRRVGNVLDVSMRNEEGETESRGAKIVRQRAVAHDHDILTPEPAVVVVADGVGAADPIVVDDGAWGLLAFVDLAERARFVPLSSGGALPLVPSPADGGGAASARRPSAEPMLEGGRVLASRAAGALVVAGRLAARIGRGSDRGAVVIAAGSKQDRAEARILLCER